MMAKTEALVIIIVAVVAVVGLLTMTPTLDGNNISGQAFAAKGTTKTTSGTAGKTGTLSLTYNKCTDSDGGQDVYTKGTTKGELLSAPTAGVKSYTDSCYDTATVKEYYCVTDKNKLSLYGQEDTGAVNQELIDCARGEICNSAICAAAVDFEVTEAAMYVLTDGTTTFSAQVKNSGSIDATLDDLYLELEWQNDDGTGGGIGASFTVTQTIEAGTTETVTVETAIDKKWAEEVIAGSTSKKITATIMLDNSETVAETDETNNLNTRTLGILGVGAEQIALS